MIKTSDIEVIIDKDGNKKVILDYKYYEELMYLLEDIALVKAMEEVEDSESVSREDIFKILDSEGSD